MNNIVYKENEARSIEKLAAQNSIYREAKQCTIAKLYICVIIVVLLTYVGVFIKELENWIVFYSVFAGFISFFIDNKINSLKITAAKTQNMFDLYLYNIKWSELIFGQKVEHEIICRYNEKYTKRNNGDISKLQNWYDIQIEDVPFNVAKIICQKSSCRYDHGLRKKFNFSTNMVFSIALFLILITLFFIDLNFLNFLKIIVAPLFPIIQWGISNYMQQDEALKKNEELNNHMNASWISLINNQIEYVDDTQIEQQQYALYQYRCQSPLIPDWFYNKHRDKKEYEMHYSVSNLIEEYTGSLNN